MITEIPSPDEFTATGISLLNLAWDTVSSLYLHTEHSHMETWDDDGQVADEFWQAAHQPLANAQALIHQGLEFLLKGKIAELSPFLLLDRAIREWPKNSSIQDTPFAEFRTIDAQDLCKVHDTVCKCRLDADFVQRIDELRRTRNTFMHSVDKRKRHSPDSLWLSILDVSHYLVGPCQWVQVRRQYLEDVPQSVAFLDEGPTSTLSGECERLLKLLKPADAAKFLGVNAKSRWYVCYCCAMELREHGVQPQTAQLAPNTPEADSVYCFVCTKTQTVSRKDCIHDGCKGNVIHAEDGVCLTCFDDQG